MDELLDGIAGELWTGCRRSREDIAETLADYFPAICRPVPGTDKPKILDKIVEKSAEMDKQLESELLRTAVLNYLKFFD